jgi:N-glycosylase/DNA lyase
MNEQELRDILKIVRQLEHYIERCLRTEKEKNEERIKKQLEGTRVLVYDSEEEYVDSATEIIEDFEL